MKKFSIKWHSSIKEIPESFWDKLKSKNHIPFFEWSWLKSLEDSQSVCPKTGWQPLFLGVWNIEKLIAVAPLYLKNHSFGEFIFDSPFVELANHLDLNYYPKLIGMSPFSPIEGYRFFILQDENEQEVTNLIIKEIDRFALKNGINSCNFLYVDPAWKRIAEAAGCAKWLNKQSLWQSNNQNNFSDYLAEFNSNQRRNIKRERSAINKAGIRIETLAGHKINEHVITNMHDFYEDHCSRWGIWGSKYLSKDFFQNLAQSRQLENLLIFAAFRENINKPIAMSLCITDREKLWGRYWGSKEEINFLHFELCYYAPIEWAINHGIRSFDPGAGGSHKLRRGFVAKPTVSLHRWYNNRMDSLIRAWLPKINNLMVQEINAINNELPFSNERPSIQSQGTKNEK